MQMTLTNTENTHQLDQIKHVNSLEHMMFGYVYLNIKGPVSYPLFTASC